MKAALKASIANLEDAKKAAMEQQHRLVGFRQAGDEVETAIEERWLLVRKAQVTAAEEAVKDANLVSLLVIAELDDKREPLTSTQTIYIKAPSFSPL